ncbi:ABC transporter substrate-binding protein [Lactococcus laudensis]|nr:ABC transporter substrate-binding protein [Lactococcus laudensis]
MRDNKKNVMLTFSLIGIFFLVFLIFPLLTIFYQAFVSNSTINLTNFKNLISNSVIRTSFIDSLMISFQTSLLATLIGFVFAYCVNFTTVFKGYKRLIGTLIILPMLVPTIVYGFAIIYSFGKQGIITRLVGFQLLANPIYKNTIAIPNINSSSTAWLMIQALIDTYGESEAKTIFAKILDNVGPNLEDSGSGPIKKLRTGEVAVGFGLRQQGIVDEKAGLPIKVVEVKEGNYLLTESVALLKHKTMNPNDKKWLKFLPMILEKLCKNIIQQHFIKVKMRRQPNVFQNL